MVVGHADLLSAVQPRPIAQPLPDHPGNLFLAGEEVVLHVPAEHTNLWRLLNYEDQTVAELASAAGRLTLGRLPVGWYRVRQPADPDSPWVALGVLEPLRAPTPATSPVALDVAMAWFYPKEKMAAAANLCALAGVNWVRDRLSWGELEPRRQSVTSVQTRYDASAQAQAAAGLQVLQVNHSSPGWANPDHKRFPLDLRDAYRFHQALARRWAGQVLAFEPWNEADIDVFGGHTGADIASLQKASFLGLKAGHPGGLACQNVFAVHRPAQLEDFHENQAWPYFDTFNLHHYEPLDRYSGLYAAFRAVSAGRPLWVSECAVPVKWAGDPKLKEPSDADLKVQAERLPKTFALSIHEGSAATFYFMLPHYVEGQTQFGIVRPDLTPRPAFLGLAAVGRLLADARPLGSLPSTNPAVRAYLFRAQPDGQARSVLVAWTTGGHATLALPRAPIAVYDHLGRTTPSGEAVLGLASAPLLALLPDQHGLSPQPPPAAPARLEGRPSPVVFQVLFPTTNTVLDKSAYRVSSEKPERIAVFAYNFGDQPVRGSLRLTAPAGWQVSAPADLELQPMERKELPVTVDCRAGPSKLVEKLRLTGDFGPAGQPVLAFRLMPEPNRLAVREATPIPGAVDPARWERMISGDGSLTVTPRDGGLVIEARPGGSDRWLYPRYTLATTERPPAGTMGLFFTVELLEGEGQFRAIFDEQNGASYVADVMVQPKRGQPLEAVACFDNATFGEGWSKPDPNGHLDPSDLRSFKIGCNTKTSHVKFILRNLRWGKL